MKLQQIFKDHKFNTDGVQNVANMIVIPITTEKPCTAISDEKLVVIKADSDYGSLTLQNQADKPQLVEFGSMYMTKGSAQDRMIKETQIIDGNKSKHIKVFCVQPGGPGHHKEGEANLSFAPKALRVTGLEKKDVDNYDGAWDDIKKDFGVSNLQDFFKYNQKELNEFVAQFENVDKQVGAVILINGQVVGVEYFPNYGVWDQMWRKYIRDCWGAEAKRLIGKESVVQLKEIVDVDRVSTLADLESEMGRVIETNLKNIQDITNEMLNKELDETTVTKTSGDFEITHSQTIGQEFIGQTVKHLPTEEIVYLGLLKKR